MHPQKNSRKSIDEITGPGSPFFEDLVFEDEDLRPEQDNIYLAAQAESPFYSAFLGDAGIRSTADESHESENLDDVDFFEGFYDESEELNDDEDLDDHEDMDEILYENETIAREFESDRDAFYDLEEEDASWDEADFEGEDDELYDGEQADFENEYEIEYDDEGMLEEAFVDNLKNLLDLWRQKASSAAQPPLPLTTPTGRKLKLPIVSTPMPKSSQYKIYTRSRYYGIPETIAALKWIGYEWAKLYPHVRMYIGDISQMGGGNIPPHKSHRIGLDVDVQLWINGKRIRVGYEKPVPGKSKAKSRIIESKAYQSQRRYVRDFVKVIKSNPYLPIRQIGFRDLALIKETKNLVQDWEGHYKHLHLRFCMPVHRSAQLDLKKVYSSREWKPPYSCNKTDTPVVSASPLSFQFDFSSAVEKNERYAVELGWDKHRTAVEEILGFTDMTPLPKVFAEAVAEWQKANGFADKDIDGVIGPKTWEKMRIALNLNSAVEFPFLNITNAIEKNQFYAEKLRWESHRAEIERLMGFTNMTPLPKVFVKAVAQWQEANGFKGKDVDGIIGPKTWEKIKIALNLQSASPAPLPRPDTQTPPRGSANRKSYDYIDWVQSSLNNIDGAGLVEDGDFGSLTKAAIKNFQSKHGLAPTGTPDSQTEEKLIANGAILPPRAPAQVANAPLSHQCPHSPFAWALGGRSQKKFYMMKSWWRNKERGHPALVGDSLRKMAPQIFPGVPVEAFVGFIANSTGIKENTTDTSRNKFHEIGLFGTEAGPRYGPAPNPDPNAEDNSWGKLANHQLVKMLLGGRTATMAPNAWQSAVEDQVAIGLVNLRLRCHKVSRRLDASIRPVMNSSSLYFIICGFMGWSAGSRGASIHLNNYKHILASVHEDQRWGIFLRAVADDITSGILIPRTGQKHKNAAYSALRTWQKITAGQIFAREIGGNVNWFDSKLGNDEPTLADVITCAANKARRK